MAERDSLDVAWEELREGMGLTKCRQCGCMKEMLDSLRSSPSLAQGEKAVRLVEIINGWLAQMKPIRYACFGCAHCYPAVATNALGQAFPEAAFASVNCSFETRSDVWPPVPGEYFASCDGECCPVAVSTLASVDLAENLTKARPKELCIVGKTETENIGIDKVIKNTVTNPTIRFLVVAGSDPGGHHSGKTLLALSENGVDEKMRVIGSPGKRPILRNVTREEVEAFRKQVTVVDMIGCEDLETLLGTLRELSQGVAPSCECEECGVKGQSLQVVTPSVIQAKEPVRMEMDRAGYFVVFPQPARGVVVVEHYAYDNRLLRVIEGTNARSIYSTVISSGWVTKLSHAAYLGRELAKAELSMKLGFKYVQDGA